MDVAAEDGVVEDEVVVGDGAVVVPVAAVAADAVIVEEVDAVVVQTFR